MFWSLDHSGYKHLSELIVAMPSKYVIFILERMVYLVALCGCVLYYIPSVAFVLLVSSPSVTERLNIFSMLKKNSHICPHCRKTKSRPSLAVVGSVVFLLLGDGVCPKQLGLFVKGNVWLWPRLLLPEWELTMLCCVGTDCAVSVLTVFWMQR